MEKSISLSFRHRVVIEENLTDQENYIELPEEDASPMTFFQMFFSKDIVRDIVEQTNFYSVRETGKSIKLTENEFNDFLAIHIIMGIVEMPSYLDYWSQKFRYDNVAEIMPLKRYQPIRRYLHFIDNNHDNGDRYYKIRPILEKVRQNCLKLQRRENKFSIDEMMIAYKGGKYGKRKKYIKDKPNKWGFKNYVRAGVSDTIYDFVMYGGEDTFRHHSFTEEESTLGFGAQVVLALCQSIHRKPATVYCDNFSSSLEIFYILRENYGVFALGTIRNNSLRGAEKLFPEKRK
ncbi:chimeric ERCC6-PGBD3 protein [Trichonephila inaurata madagascariensis]|uniref:Chimeric ERCC6-PGBD3 protein n=1 Tax=Trichonephila inaurata madagascariensis TaxID=2747483 RepID=A0A8X7BW31_9ARAC|nr:chimeric ERCC6-PGBD3 protein [Trichonephila inaurata madagascariensis]